MIRFGITREHSIAVERLALLCAAASTACECQVSPVIFDSYHDLAQAIHHGTTDIVWAPPIAAGVVDSVVEGKTDAGATYCHLDRAGKMITAAWTLPDGASIRPGSSMLRFLLDPSDDGKAALRSVFNTSEFRIAKMDHFAPLRHMVRTASARGHDALRPGAVRLDR